jgi:deazaflavin-dependent oxidoreductase (nitroreductase family)
MAKPTTTTSTGERYLQPGWFTQHVLNAAVGRLARLGLAPKGLRQLAVRGRTSGEWKTTPVNLLEHDGRRYLVAPRGLTQWVRNIRVAGGGELRLGRRVEPIAVTELADADKPVVLREYVRAWKSEVKEWFEGIDETSSDAELLAIADGFPVFEVRAA